jgi:hypothetical protein
MSLLTRLVCEQTHDALLLGEGGQYTVQAVAARLGL